MKIAVPAFLTITVIPLSFSIANGLAFGFTAYTFLQMLTGAWRKLNPVMYVLTALFLIRFWYLGAG
jgi:AGZA family xanthine/uracil permease-like MFS transporter